MVLALTLKSHTTIALPNNWSPILYWPKDIDTHLAHLCLSTSISTKLFWATCQTVEKYQLSQKEIDWFLPTVTEDIYASAKAMCLTQKIQGTLEWGDMVLLFNHTCFARYPHFQIAELQTGRKEAHPKQYHLPR